METTRRTKMRYQSNSKEESLQTTAKLKELESSVTSDPIALKKRQDQEIQMARELATKQNSFWTRLSQSKHQREIAAAYQNKLKESLELALESEIKNVEVIETVKLNITKEFANSLQKAVRSVMKGNVNSVYMQNSSLLIERLEGLNDSFLDLMEKKLENMSVRHPQLHDMIDDQFNTAKSKWMDQYEAVLAEFTQLLDDMVK